MVDPLTGAALDSALAGITSAMSGQTAQQAYDARMDSTYTDASGITIGVGNYTDDVPAISGNTNNTMSDSAESDPQEAWLDWMHDGGLVNETTGGAELGSTAGTTNYVIGQNSDDSLQALQPVAVPVDQAVVALGQALGVSMKLSEVDPVLANKLTQALVLAGVVYDKAKGLVTAWKNKDGQVYVPKDAIDAIAGVFEEEGVGPEGDSTGTYPSKYPGVTGIFSQGAHSETYNGRETWDLVSVTGIIDHFVVTTWNGQQTIIGKTQGSYQTKKTYSDGDTLTYTDTNTYPLPVGGRTYWTGPIRHEDYNQSPARNQSGIDIDVLTDIYYNGTVVPGGSFPPGTEESEAPGYTKDTIPPGPGILGRGIGSGVEKVVDTIGLHLPDDPYNTKGDTTDPKVETPDDRTDGLPAPPIPVPIPETKPSNPDVPTTRNPSQTGEEVAKKVDELVEDLANTVDPQPPQSSGLIPIPPFMPGTPVDPTDPSAGSIYPSYVPASGSGLIHVYNPTSAEFVAFGQWLWVTYADATIDKIWNNPFDGIIGAHELYATPQVDGRDNIRSGFLVCPTAANLVRQRYTEIDCGTVVVPEFYGNYFDYSPYSQCYIYLPFIGINEVSIDDIVGHAVNIRYRVDAYTGSCIAMIYVAKQGYRNLCYQYGGNCAVEVPLAGGSQAAIKAGVLQAEAYARATVQSAQIQKTASIGTGIVNGASSGAGAGAMNPVAGIVGGLLGALAGGTSGYIQGSANYGAAKLNAGAMQEAAKYANKSSVQHSGQFGASHGAMGLKNPFIMIRNPIQVKVTNYNEDYGFPAHKRVIIGGCRGYLRVKEVNVVSAHATNEEKIAIETALKEGVYVS